MSRRIGDIIMNRHGISYVVKGYTIAPNGKQELILTQEVEKKNLCHAPECQWSRHATTIFCPYHQELANVSKSEDEKFSEDIIRNN